jgi:hypothetical protein
MEWCKHKYLKLCEIKNNLDNSNVYICEWCKRIIFWSIAKSLKSTET